jgi:intraflagellar transport protein 122
VLAYQEKYVDAANLLVKNGLSDKAVDLFTELKNYDEAKRFSKFQKNDANISKILRDQAEWAKDSGDWKAAAELFITTKEYKKAI